MYDQLSGFVALAATFPSLSGAFTSRIVMLDLAGSFSYTFLHYQNRSVFFFLFYEILTKNEKASPTFNLALIEILIKNCLIKIYNSVNDG